MMAVRTLDHIGIAVPSIDDAIPTWSALTGATPTWREVLTDQGVEVAFLGDGPGRIELLSPIRAGTPVSKFLERRGPGLHHLCYRVPDLRAALSAHAGAGFELIDHEPRHGAQGHMVAFLHPRTSGGVLIELVEAGDAIAPG